MRKLAFALFAAIVVLAGGVAMAGGRHGHGHGHGGGWHGGGRYWGGGYRGGWGWGWGGGVVIGGPGWWGNPYRYYGGYWGGGYPYWGAGYGYGYGVPYALPRPIIVEQQPQVYVQQQQPASQYWYYCQDPAGYYPYVEKCRGDWMQVVPRSDSPEPEPR